MLLDSKHSEASFLPYLTNLPCLPVTNVPASQDLAIFVPTTTTTTMTTDGQTDYFTPCPCAWGNNCM